MLQSGRHWKDTTPGDIDRPGLSLYRAPVGSPTPQSIGLPGSGCPAAQRSYANHTALNYYHQAIGLETRWEWLSGQAEVLHLLGVRDEERAT